MNEKVLLTSPARTDIASLAEYIAEDNLSVTENFYEAVQEKCEELAQMPKMGRLCNELSSSVRSFPLGWYVIFYTIRGDRIIILRLLHGARDILSLFW